MRWRVTTRKAAEPEPFDIRYGPDGEPEEAVSVLEVLRAAGVETPEREEEQ